MKSAKKKCCYFGPNLPRSHGVHLRARKIVSPLTFELLKSHVLQQKGQVSGIILADYRHCFHVQINLEVYIPYTPI